MKIIILGAGQVGGTLAENLTHENNDITLVDHDKFRLAELQRRFDIRTVCQHASLPSTLHQAGCEDADMIIAVTHSDEVNIVGCQVAFTLFHTPTKIARVRNTSYLHHRQLFDNKAMPIDVLISPEQLLTSHIQHLIEYPGVQQILDFADGLVRLVAIRLQAHNPLVNQSVGEVYQSIDTPFRFSALYRDDRAEYFNHDTVLQAGDLWFFVSRADLITTVLQSLQGDQQPYRRITIAGGGNIGMRLAERLEEKFQVKLIEHSKTRCAYLAEHLNHCCVLQGDAQDKQLLLEENVDSTDMFCTLTNDDETNIISALQAKRLGARTVMALCNRTAYVDLLRDSDLDYVISPQLATIGKILTYIRRGDFVNVHTLNHGAAEAFELIVHGDQQTSKIVGRSLAGLKLPFGTTLGAIIRGKEVIIPRDDAVIAEDDHLVLFMADKKRIHELERLFQVNIGFFNH